jgi:hypothetical protein
MLPSGLTQSAPKGKRRLAVSIGETACPQNATLFATIVARKRCTTSFMDPTFDIPKDRKSLSVLRLCLIMGMTALLFIVVFDRLGKAAEAIIMAPKF